MSEPTRTMLDRAREALTARMTKDDLRLVLENVVTYAAELEAQRERRRLRLVTAEADLLEMRGLLSPHGQPRRVPAEVEIHERVAPAVEWLLNRVAELEARITTARTEAIADVGDWLDEHGEKGAAHLVYTCDIPAARDMKRTAEDRPGMRRAVRTLTPDEAAAAEQPLTVYRASHDSIVMGLYTTAAEARKHCETEMRRDLPTVALDWIEDEEDGVAELVASVDEDERATGYVVDALEVAAAYDDEVDE
jgi:hypothetical protein